MNQILKIELKRLINSDEKFILIDVRSYEEYIISHIPNSINIPMEKLEENLNLLNEFDKIVTICGKGGGRSEKAANYLKEHVKGEVYFLEGGTINWYNSL